MRTDDEERRMAALVTGTGRPLLCAPSGADMLALGPASATRGVLGPRPKLGSLRLPPPVASRAQPQMSSHNSRLAADSYKNCVWTVQWRSS